MCFGKSKSSTPQPAPVVAQPNPNSVADNSNDLKARQQVVASTTPQTPSFGSELGTGSDTKTGT